MAQTQTEFLYFLNDFGLLEKWKEEDAAKDPKDRPALFSLESAYRGLEFMTGIVKVDEKKEQEQEKVVKKQVDASMNEKKGGAKPVVEEKGDATPEGLKEATVTPKVTNEKIVDLPEVTVEKENVVDPPVVKVEKGNVVDPPVVTKGKENVVEKDDAKLAPGDLDAANKKPITKMNTYSKLDTDFPAGNPKGAIDALNAKNETFKINTHGKQRR